MDKYLAHDAETGGLSAKIHSHLTHYFGVFTYENGRFVLQRDLDLRIKPNVGEKYCVTEEAMRINKIDLVKHDQVAITRDEAAMKLYYFLKEESNDGANRLIRMGHNEPFDKEFIVSNLLNENIWREFTDYHTLDSIPIAKSLKMKGKIAREAKLNLKELAKYLGVPFNEVDLHTAKGDTHLFVRVLEVLLTL